MIKDMVDEMPVLSLMGCGISQRGQGTQNGNGELVNDVHFDSERRSSRFEYQSKWFFFVFLNRGVILKEGTDKAKSIRDGIKNDCLWWSERKRRKRPLAQRWEKKKGKVK